MPRHLKQTTLSRFHRLPGLPREIQIIIWTYAFYSTFLLAQNTGLLVCKAASLDRALHTRFSCIGPANERGIHSRFSCGEEKNIYVSIRKSKIGCQPWLCKHTRMDTDTFVVWNFAMSGGTGYGRRRIDGTMLLGDGTGSEYRVVMGKNRAMRGMLETCYLARHTALENWKSVLGSRIARETAQEEALRVEKGWPPAPKERVTVPQMALDVVKQVLESLKTRS